MGTTSTLSIPYPEPDDTVDVPRDIKALADAVDPLGVVPVGAFMMWLTAVAPLNWLFMHGQTVDASLYPKLATLLGQVGGLVTIPDMRNLFPAGAGNVALGATGGAASVALSVAEMPSHNHGGLTGARDRSQAHAHGVDFDNWQTNLGSQTYVTIFRQPGTGPAVANTRTVDPPDHLHTITAQGGSAAHENRPPFRAINFIIRAG